MQLSSTGFFFFTGYPHQGSRGSCLRARGCSDSNGCLSGTLRLQSVWGGQRWLLECVSHTFLASGESWLSRWFTRAWQESIHHGRATKRGGHGRSPSVRQRSRFILFIISCQLHTDHFVCLGFFFLFCSLLFQKLAYNNTIAWTKLMFWHVTIVAVNQRPPSAIDRL